MILLININYRRDLMKKIVSVLVILTVFSATVFAAPGSLSVPLDNSRPAGSKTFAIGALSAGVVPQVDDLFADVGAVQLTDTEAQTVEGDGPIAVFAGAIVGTVLGMTVVLTKTYTYTPSTPSRNNATSAAAHIGAVVVGYAGLGAIMGACLPTP
jgi:hypothetical protein